MEAREEEGDRRHYLVIIGVNVAHRNARGSHQFLLFELLQGFPSRMSAAAHQHPIDRLASSVNLIAIVAQVELPRRDEPVRRIEKYRYQVGNKLATIEAGEANNRHSPGSHGLHVLMRP